MKIAVNINDITVLDGEPMVGSLVKSTVDSSCTGMIVEVLSKGEYNVLWSKPPEQRSKKTGEIW